MQSIIVRDQYLNRLIKEKDNELIKVITGIRRSGKTYVLKMFQKYLLDNDVSENNIIYLNFESFDNEKYKNINELYKYVISNYSNQKMYLFFDEIQQVPDWQRVINSFRIDIDADIYITGSNASILSGELSTLIAGRYIEIQVFPLSFIEYLKFKNIDKNDKRKVFLAYDEFFRYGGMPTTINLLDEEQKLDYLSSVYDSIILKDIASRSGGAKNIDTLQRIILFLLDSIGSEISVNNIERRLRSNEIGVSRTTLNNYFKLMEEAFIFYNVPKYDIKGAKQLITNGKYYIADTGLWNSQIRKLNNDLGHKLENLVFIELLRRKYSIQIGSYHSKEIDFVATRNGVREYYQVAYDLPKKSDREINNLLSVPDNYKKILIVSNLVENSDINGIEVINIIDWLLQE